MQALASADPAPKRRGRPRSRPAAAGAVDAAEVDKLRAENEALRRALALYQGVAPEEVSLDLLPAEAPAHETTAQPAPILGARHVPRCMPCTSHHSLLCSPGAGRALPLGPAARRSGGSGRLFGCLQARRRRIMWPPFYAIGQCCPRHRYRHRHRHRHRSPRAPLPAPTHAGGSELADALAAGIRWPAPGEGSFWERAPRDAPLPIAAPPERGGAGARDERSMHIVHITAEMAPCAKVCAL